MPISAKIFTRSKIKILDQNLMSQRFLTRANCLHTIFVTKIFAFYVFTDFRI